MDSPNVNQVPQPRPNVNQPTSGTYGSQAELDRLASSVARQKLQAQNKPQGLPGSALVEQPGRPEGRPPSVPPGISPVILQSGPMPPPGPAVTPTFEGAVLPSQRTIAILDALATSPEVSASTREWARLVLRTIFG